VTEQDPTFQKSKFNTEHARAGPVASSGTPPRSQLDGEERGFCKFDNTVGAPPCRINTGAAAQVILLNQPLCVLPFTVI